MAARLTDPLRAPGVATDLAALVALRAELPRERRRDERALLPLAGENRSRRRGHGMEFEDLRLYEPGDETRHIDWNVTARAGELHIRQFRDEQAQQTLVLVDLRSCMLFGTRRALRSVAACELAALYAWNAARRGHLVGGVCVTDDAVQVAPPRAGRQAPLRLLGLMHHTHEQALEAWSQRPEPSLRSGVAALARLARRGGSAILLSALDSPGEGFVGALAELGGRTRLRVVQVVDPFERAPVAAGRYAFSFAPAVQAVRRLPAPTPLDEADAAPAATVAAPLAAAGIAVAKVSSAEPPAAAFRQLAADGFV